MTGQDEGSQQDLWTEVDDYFESQLRLDHAAAEAALRASTQADLPPIAVAPNQGKLLEMLVVISGAKRVLEVGTLGGYSTLWLARSLPEGGQVVTLEIDERHAAVARSNFETSSLSDRIDLRLGPAADSLQAMVEEGEEPFDFVFIDADKPSTPIYFERSIQLTPPGSLIVVDNVVRGGGVVDADSDDANIQGMRRFFDEVATLESVDGTVVQTVGSKGYDGLALFRRT